MIQHFDIVEPLINPDFSTINRVGWKCIIIKQFDEKNVGYLSVVDRLGVSWPLEESKVKVIGSLIKESIK